MTRTELSSIADLGSRVRALVDQVERERDDLRRTARPLEGPIEAIDHWQHVAERVIPLIPVILAGALAVVLALWASGRWNQHRVRRWLTLAAEAFALWRSIAPLYRQHAAPLSTDRKLP